MKKKCANPPCGKDFETDSKKKIFCSTRCRVAFGRSLAKGDVTTANKIGVPVHKTIPLSQVVEEYKSSSQVKETLDKAAISFDRLKSILAWYKPIEEYCNKNGCLPSDLIAAHQSKHTSSIGSGKGTVTGSSRNPRTGKVMQVIDGEKVQEAPAGETYMEKRLRLKNTGSKS